jgi:hypothetical protein
VRVREAMETVAIRRFGVGTPEGKLIRAMLVGQLELKSLDTTDNDNLQVGTAGAGTPPRRRGIKAHHGTATRLWPFRQPSRARLIP